jgi:hypothetical protein
VIDLHSVNGDTLVVMVHDSDFRRDIA